MKKDSIWQDFWPTPRTVTIFDNCLHPIYVIARIDRRLDGLILWLHLDI